MSGKRHLEEMARKIEAGVAAPPVPRPNRSLSAPTQLFNFSADFQRVSAELEKAKANQAEGALLKIKDLKSSPYQQFGLDEQRVQGLVDNLKNNPLTTPVVVRKLADGSYELIAGHHRTEAFVRLERDEIRAIVVDLSDDEVKKVVFYDNLLAPSLSAYQKYLGFSFRMKDGNLTQAEVAEEAGVSQSIVSKIMSFDRLPDDIKEIIASNPKNFSIILMPELVELSAKNHASALEVAKRVSAGEAALKSLIDSVERTMPKQKPVSLSAQEKLNKPGPVVFVHGSTHVAEMNYAKKNIVFKFKNATMAEQASKMLSQFLTDNIDKLS
ncbi:ParB/RepB/Spo0J family partition protein [Nostoc sp. CHAB 5834]|nr:ParB/RepB/Spo0J family partition protein [Nostoc sp. CHAB 5834]